MLPYMMVAIFSFTAGKPEIQDLGKYIHYIMISINPIYSCAGFFFMINKVCLCVCVFKLVQPPFNTEDFLFSTNWMPRY